MKLSYLGTVSDGRLKLSERKQFDKDLIQFEGKRIELTLAKAKKSRSNNQNRYYWGLVLPCAVAGFRDAGNDTVTIEDAHDFFKGRFLTEGKQIIIPRTGEVFTVSKSTTVISTTEMMTYTEQIARFCAEMLNVIIPEPSPLWDINQNE